MTEVRRILGGVVWTALGDDLVILKLDPGIYLGLDRVGARIWRLIAHAGGENHPSCALASNDEDRIWLSDSGPIITWEEIQNAYADVTSAAYFVRLLKVAIDGYEKLRGRRLAFGENADDQLPGAEILRQYEQGLLQFQMMGRCGHH